MAIPCKLLKGVSRTLILRERALGIGLDTASDRVLRATSTCALWRAGVGIGVAVNRVWVRLAGASGRGSSGQTSTANEFVDVRVKVNLSGPVT